MENGVYGKELYAAPQQKTNMVYSIFTPPIPHPLPLSIGIQKNLLRSRLRSFIFDTIKLKINGLMVKPLLPFSVYIISIWSEENNRTGATDEEMLKIKRSFPFSTFSL